MTLLEILDGLLETSPEADRAAAELDRLVRKQVRMQVRRSELSSDDEDAVQDISIQVMRLNLENKLPREHEGQSRLYLQRIVRSRVADVYRAVNREIRSEDIEAAANTNWESPGVRGAEPEGESLDDIETIESARRALRLAFDLALNNRQPRWRKSLQQSWEMASELERSGMSAEELLLQRGDLSPDADKKARVNAVNVFHKAQQRLREGIWDAAGQFEEEGDKETADLVRLSCAHLLRRHRVCQNVVARAVPPVEGTVP